MTIALEAFGAADFDWTRQLRSIWKDPPYHIADLHKSRIDELIRYFDSRTRDPDPIDEPLGQVIVGPAGHGKTHLIGELRRRVWERGGWFILLDFIGIKDFWSSVALGFLNSLQVRMPDGQTQYDQLVIRLGDMLKLHASMVEISNSPQGSADELLKRLISLFFTALSRRYPQEALKHQDVITALVLLISEDLACHSVAHAWLQGMNLDKEVTRPLGFIGHDNRPDRVVDGLSWILSLIGPTLIAVDQIDAIVAASDTRKRVGGDAGPQEQAEAHSIVEQLSEGLMSLHERKRRAVTVISCLEATWKVLGTSQAACNDRYHDALALHPLNSREMIGKLIAARLAPAYEAAQFQPPYPTWPFSDGALESARGLSPRKLLKACEEHRRRCIGDGKVAVCETFEATAAPVRPSDATSGANALDVRFASALKTATLSGVLTNEDRFRDLLDTTLRLFEKHLDLPDDIDVAVQRDPDQKRPSLHGRLSFTFHSEGDREQHYCFRILGHDNALAFQSRLKAAMTASGIDRALKFRHLYIFRNGATPGGAKTQALVDQFIKAGGKFVVPSEDDMRKFAALSAMATDKLDGFDDWLRTRRPLFETALFKSLGLAPPAFERPAPAGAVPISQPSILPKSVQQSPNLNPGPAKPTGYDHAPEQPQPIAGRRTIPLGVQYSKGRLGDQVALAADLLTRHVAIIAGSGSGKTVLLRRMIEEAALLGIPAIVLDINNDLSRLGKAWPSSPEGFTEGDTSKARAYQTKSEVVIWTPGAASGRPISLKLLPDFAAIGDKADPQTNDERAQAVEMAIATLTPYIGGTGQKGILRQGVLADALRYFALRQGGTLDELIDLLVELPEEVSKIGDSGKHASDIANQLLAAVATNPLLQSSGPSLDPQMLFNGAKGRTRISVINFSGLNSLDARLSFVNQLQMALFTWIKQHPSPTGRLYVLDEAQNFVPSVKTTSCKASAVSLAQQARKYGLGMIFATQAPKGIDNTVVGNCTTHVYGRMGSNATIEAITQIMSSRGGAADDLGRLSRGEFYFSTEGTTRPFKIKTPMCLSYHPANAPTADEVLTWARQGG